MPAWLQAEVAEWRRRHTYGGFEWFPDAAEPEPAKAHERLSAAELLEEVVWLLDGGTHPLMISQQVDRRPNSIYASAKRLNHERVREAFAQFCGGRIAAA